MEDRNVVVVRESIVVIAGVPALEFEGIATSFQDENLAAILGEPRGDRASARPGTDDDIFELLSSLLCSWCGSHLRELS